MAAEDDDRTIELTTSLAGGVQLAVRVRAPSPAARQGLTAAAARALTSARVALGTACQLLAQRTGDPRTGGEAPFQIVGKSHVMTELFSKLERVARSDASVLVTGENGTGKELVARAIHERSGRSAGPFVATNCSAFNDNLLESELFGHRRGAFTGAVQDKQGLFETAHGGTFLLDEVGDMSPALQVKLLRVLQEGTFTPVGGTATQQVDVRIVAATNRNLAEMVRSGNFREDLYYRLHVVELRTPPLRERGDDLTLLLAHFLARLQERYSCEKQLEVETVARLLAHRWPGNVRELENEVERVWVLSGDAPLIEARHLNGALLTAPMQRQQMEHARQQMELLGGPTGASRRQPLTAPGPAAGSETRSLTLHSSSKLPETLREVERQLIAAALERSGGNRTRAAEQLGISRRNLIRKLQSLGLTTAPPDS